MEEWEALRRGTASGRAYCLEKYDGRETNAGVVTFHRLSDTKTRVMLQMEYMMGVDERT